MKHVTFTQAAATFGLCAALLAPISGHTQETAKPLLPSPFGKPETALGFAIDQGCLTYLREGGDVATYVDRYARTVTEDGKRMQKIYGGGVMVSEDGRGGCYIRVRRGDGASLRDALFDTFRSKGYRLEGFADYGPATRGRDWSYVQESYCWREGDGVFIVLVSSSALSRDVTLQATIFRDKEDIAAKKGLCLAK